MKKLLLIALTLFLAACQSGGLEDPKFEPLFDAQSRTEPDFGMLEEIPISLGTMAESISGPEAEILRYGGTIMIGGTPYKMADDELGLNFETAGYITDDANTLLFKPFFMSENVGVHLFYTGTDIEDEGTATITKDINVFLRGDKLLGQPISSAGIVEYNGRYIVLMKADEGKPYDSGTREGSLELMINFDSHQEGGMNSGNYGTTYDAEGEKTGEIDGLGISLDGKLQLVNTMFTGMGDLLGYNHPITGGFYGNSAARNYLANEFVDVTKGMKDGTPYIMALYAVADSNENPNVTPGPPIFDEAPADEGEENEGEEVAGDGSESGNDGGEGGEGESNSGNEPAETVMDMNNENPDDPQDGQGMSNDGGMDNENANDQQEDNAVGNIYAYTSAFDYFMGVPFEHFPPPNYRQGIDEPENFVSTASTDPDITSTDDGIEIAGTIYNFAEQNGDKDLVIIKQSRQVGQTDIGFTTLITGTNLNSLGVIADVENINMLIHGIPEYRTTQKPEAKIRYEYVNYSIGQVPSEAMQNAEFEREYLQSGEFTLNVDFANDEVNLVTIDEVDLGEFRGGQISMDDGLSIRDLEFHGKNSLAGEPIMLDVDFYNNSSNSTADIIVGTGKSEMPDSNGNHRVMGIVGTGYELKDN